MRFGSLLAGLVLACGPGETPVARSGAIEILDPRLPAPPTADAPAALYLRIRNVGEVGDTLQAIRASFAARAAVHGTDASGRMVRQTAVVPAGGTVELAPGGRHAMLEGLTRRLAAGDTVDVALQFAVAGTIAVRVPVIDYADLLERTR